MMCTHGNPCMLFVVSVTYTTQHEHRLNPLVLSISTFVLKQRMMPSSKQSRHRDRRMQALCGKIKRNALHRRPRPSAAPPTSYAVACSTFLALGTDPRQTSYRRPLPRPRPRPLPLPAQLLLASIGNYQGGLVLRRY